MATRRTQSFTVDVSGSRARDTATNRTLGESDFWLFRYDGNLLRFTFQDTTDNGATWSAYVIPAAAVLKCGVKSITSAGEPTGDYLAYAGNELWNVDGDWADADRAAGKCGVRLDLNTAAVQAALTAAAGKITALLEVEMTVPGELPVTLCQIRVEIRNDVNRGDESDPAEADPPYATKDYADAIATDIKTPENGHYRLEGGYLKLWDRTTSTFRPVELDNGALVVVEAP